jgi:hypothetical protein
VDTHDSATPRAASAWISHNIPGRLRVRLPGNARVGNLVDTLRRREGVTACTWSPRTRGLLIRYRPEEVTADELIREVADEGGVGIDEPTAQAPVSPALVRPSPIATAVLAAGRDLNMQLRRRTHGAVGLGTLVPVALTAWALLEIVRGRVAPLAWSSALWYAHGLFRDYNSPPADS